MSNGFLSVARKNFPHAKICIDPFHMIQRFNDMVDQVRLRYQNQGKADGNPGRIPKPEGYSPASENQRIPSGFLLGNTPAGEPPSAL